MTIDAVIAAERAASKRRPEGNGYWIAFAPPIKDALKALRDLKAEWVAPRLGQNGWNDPGSRKELLEEYKADGLALYPWIYITPNGSVKAIEAFKRVVDLGLANGIILDCEVEFCNYPEIARSLAIEVRQAFPSLWIAHAPFDLPLYHVDFPYRELATGLDAVMPQLYAYEHSDAGYDSWIREYETQWRTWEAKYPESILPRFPVGCSYRPKLRGGVPTSFFDSSKLAEDIVTHQAYMTGGLYSLEMAMQNEVVFDRLRKAAWPSEPPTNPKG